MLQFFKRMHLVVLTVGTLLAGPAAFAKTCELTIEGNDQMQFNKDKLVVKKDCTKVKLTLKHAGKLPKSAMGHNWILTTAGDMQKVAGAAAKAGLSKNYVPESDKVIAHTGLIGGGKSTSVTFDVSNLKKGGDYKFFCSFPGHMGTMQGTFVVKK